MRLIDVFILLIVGFYIVLAVLGIFKL